MLNKWSKIVLMVLLSGYVASALIDPTDKIFHLKIPLFILAASVWGLRVLFGATRPGGIKLWVGILFFVLALPIIATIIGLCGSSLPVGNPTFAILKGFSVLLLIPIISTEKIDLSKHIIIWSLAVALLTISFAVIKFEYPAFFTALYAFTMQTGNAMIGPRDLLGLGLGSFYYKTVPVLVFPIAFYMAQIRRCKRKAMSFVMLLIFLAAVVCSGSRATALVTFMILFVSIIGALNRKAGPAAAFLVVIVIGGATTGYFMKFFRPGQSSNKAKIGHLISYSELFNAHPGYLLWGQGADTEFYSIGFRAKTTLMGGIPGAKQQVELTYFDLIRQFGLPATSLMLIILLYPVFLLAKMNDSDKYLALPYAAYLFEAGTNPLLVGSTGFTIVSAVWGVVLARKSEAAKQNPEVVLQ